MEEGVEYNEYMSPVGIRFNRMPSNLPGKIVLYHVLVGKLCNYLVTEQNGIHFVFAKRVSPNDRMKDVYFERQRNSCHDKRRWIHTFH